VPLADPIRLFPGTGGFPLDPQELFGRSGPLVIEVGFGNATFLAGLATEHTDWNLIGADIAAASLTRGVTALRRLGLSNARVLCADARMLVSEMLGERSIHRIYVNFPDPWPKERHLDRRLLQAPFFRLLSTRLVDGGELWLTTDHAEYYEFSLQQARETGLFDIRTGPPPEAMLQTKYARRWQAEGITINHAVFALRARDDQAHPCRLEMVDMAHARLDGDLAAVKEFEKQVHDIADGHIVLVDCKRSLDGERLTVEVIVEESDLRQEVLVEVRRTPSGIYVELQSFGRPASTRGVRRAVDLVADWLVSCGLRKTESVF